MWRICKVVQHHIGISRATIEAMLCVHLTLVYPKIRKGRRMTEEGEDYEPLDRRKPTKGSRPRD